MAFSEFVDPHPATGNQFGHTVVALSTGNVVITSPYDDAGGTDAGAVYLFNGATGALISTLTGSHANDNIGFGGFGGITVLTNGNFVIQSTQWDNGAITNAGAVTWGSGVTGVSGVVSAENSLVGSTSSDFVGSSGVWALNNGNYVIHSPAWSNGGIVGAGAVTWGNGDSGISGTISSSNSLVGGTAGDNVGISPPTRLNNGNYIVASYLWDNGAATNAGAVTWGNGLTGTTGVVSSLNSLVGSSASDQVGGGGVTILSNGNYVVRSITWKNGAVTNAGAVTWGDGTTGVAGVVSAANSLVGSTANDQVGKGGVFPIGPGNFVVVSANWDNASAVNAGAVTWGSGVAGVSGVVDSANSLVGSTSNDNVGGDGVTRLSNGNYVVKSTVWDNGALADVGAVTWGSGATGISGPVNSANSLVGGTAFDFTGSDGVTALSNGHYVVASESWDNGAITDAGAATWGDGTTGISGLVTAANSLVGDSPFDNVGNRGVTALSNGNYVVSSVRWRNEFVTNAGAATWGNGATGTTGVVSASNSLVGSTAEDNVGSSGITPLSNGNYVVGSREWDNGLASNAGAATWGNGSVGVTGPISASNSFVGTSINDGVGASVTALSQGNFVVISSSWNNGTANGAGAVTWGNGTTGGSGIVSESNSLVGSSSRDFVGGSGVLALANGNYVIRSSTWNNGTIVQAGAVTWGNGATGTRGIVSASNSVVGTTDYEEVGTVPIIELSDGNYLIWNQAWSSGAALYAGAVTWGNGAKGISGVASADNSLVGLTSNTNLLPVVVDPVNRTYFGRFLKEGGGHVRVGGSASYSVASGVLTVTGTAFGDDITVRSSSGTVLIDANGGTMNTGIETASLTAIQIFGLSGNDFLRIDGTIGAAITGLLVGGDGNDVLNGGAGNDTLYGNAGNDKLAGRQGQDSLDGGDDNDTLYFEDTDIDVIGGNGIDTATVYLASAGVTLDLTANGIEIVDARSSAFDNTFDATAATWSVKVLGGTGIDMITGGDVDDTLQGGAGADILTGNGGHDRLDGQEGDDTLVGNAGNDRLIGRGGADAFDGGTGNDLLYFDDLDTSIQGGDDLDVATVYLSGAVALNLTANQIESVSASTSSANNTFDATGATWSVRILAGSGNDTLIGGNLNDILEGGGGDDLLIGKNGDDTLNGGLGIDTVSFSTAASAVSVNLAHRQATGGAGTDTLISFENVVGSDHNDTILGNFLANILDGGQGADTIVAGIGDTILNA